MFCPEAWWQETFSSRLTASDKQLGKIIPDGFGQKNEDLIQKISYSNEVIQKWGQAMQCLTVYVISRILKLFFNFTGSCWGMQNPR